MEYLLFVVYLVLFAWLVTKVKFFTRSGLNDSQLIIVFLLKIMAGIFYGWIGIYYSGLAQMWDTWMYHTESLKEHELLLNNSNEYFTNLFSDFSRNDGWNLFGPYWNDLKGNAIVKILSVFDIFSFGNYYVNVIFYSFFTLFGPLAIFRVMTDVFPKRRTEILIASFLIPSFLYWTSGIHKEGLIFTGIAIIIYVIYFSTKEKRLNLKRGIALLIGLLLLLALRNFLFVVILPAIIAWLLALRYPQRVLLVFAGCYVFFGLLFFTAKYIHHNLDLPQAVVNKRQEFINIQGRASVPMKELTPDAGSFLKNTPEAFTLSTIRPYPKDVKHILALAAALEINMLLLLFLLFLFFRRNGIISKSVIYFLLFFSLTVLLAIGFTVNNLGAIVRYRSIVLPFLVIPMVALIDWPRLAKVFYNGIRNKNNMNHNA